MPQDPLEQALLNRKDITPEMQQGIEMARKEDPTLGNVDFYGPVSNMLRPDAQGYTSPARTIYLNPPKLAGMSPEQIAGTVLHEQQHVKQMRDRGSSPIREFLSQVFSKSEPYGQRPDEMAAFQFEKDRRARLGMPDEAVPSMSGGFIYPHDINLPNEKK